MYGEVFDRIDCCSEEHILNFISLWKKKIQLFWDAKIAQEK